MCNAVLINSNFWVMVSWCFLTLRGAGEQSEPGLLGVSSLNDELVRGLLGASGLVAKSRLAPRSYRPGRPTGGLTPHHHRAGGRSGSLRNREQSDERRGDEFYQPYRG